MPVTISSTRLCCGAKLVAGFPTWVGQPGTVPYSRNLLNVIKDLEKIDTCLINRGNPIAYAFLNSIQYKFIHDVLIRRGWVEVASGRNYGNDIFMYKKIYRRPAAIDPKFTPFDEEKAKAIMKKVEEKQKKKAKKDGLIYKRRVLKHNGSYCYKWFYVSTGALVATNNEGNYRGMKIVGRRVTYPTQP